MHTVRVIKHLTGAAALVLATGLAWGANGGPIPNPEFDLDADMSAKLYKEKARQGTIADGMKYGRNTNSASADGECGNVNINSNNNQQSNSGIKEMFGKQSTTIVTGPVINAARCK